MTADERDRRRNGAAIVTTMWSVLDRVAAFERRTAALYEGFANRFDESLLVAAFWHELAGEERLHALIVGAAREVFPAAMPVTGRDWAPSLSRVEEVLSGAEARAAADSDLDAAFSIADDIEQSELNTLTALIVLQAGQGFSRLAPLLANSGVDQHRDKVLRVWRRFRGDSGREE